MLNHALSQGDQEMLVKPFFLTNLKRIVFLHAYHTQDCLERGKDASY